MNTLPEHLIDKIMLYVSHPCADMINNSISPPFEIPKFIRTDWKRSPPLVSYSHKFFPIVCANYFQIRCITSEEHERRYERKVVKRNILNKFKFHIDDQPMNYFTFLYLHFNTTLINEKDETDEIVLPDYDEYNIESDIESDYNDDDYSF